MRFKVGDKVKLVRTDDEDRYENPETYRYNEDLEGIKDNSDYGKIIKIEEPKYETVYEAKTEILDEQVCIEIELENEYISLPFFKINTMYKGMQTNRRYTLKELGL